MNLINCRFLADENIHPDLVSYFRSQDYDIKTVKELNLLGHSDKDIINESYKEERFIITHDSDFGTLAIAQGLSYSGIIYLRPGHKKGQNSIETIKTLFKQRIEVKDKMIIVAVKNNEQIKIRIRYNQ